jgi:hypothetical protein
MGFGARLQMIPVPEPWKTGALTGVVGRLPAPDQLVLHG